MAQISYVHTMQGQARASQRRLKLDRCQSLHLADADDAAPPLPNPPAAPPKPALLALNCCCFCCSSAGEWAGARMWPSSALAESGAVGLAPAYTYMGPHVSRLWPCQTTSTAMHRQQS